ncbi:hypothetical protein [Catenulispora subtropica]|uniref:Uncharacterized protein n=1 Tax=Catenulispora subtropica TaxID=450798 RepID=A0ABP5DMY1_9ACTN
MTGTEPVRTAILSDTRASAAVAARRYGVPPTMIAAAAERRAVGDWRGACAAADVEVYLNPDAVRRRHGAEVAARLLTALRGLAPDLLRWHLPRRGHGAGELLAELLVPLAELADDGDRALALVAMTPRLALDAGQRIVLAVMETGGRRRPTADCDPVIRALLDRVRVKQAERHSLVRHPMFWSASQPPGSAGRQDVTAEALAITRLQDVGDFAEAWRLGGFTLSCDAGVPSRLRWLAALPVLLTGLADRVRAALPGVDAAALRSGPGAIVLSGLNAASGPIDARAVANHDAYGLPTIPTAAWARSTDADLVRCGLLGVHELHPLVASALVTGPMPPAPEADEWLYREVPFIAGPCVADVPTLWIRCGASTHRVAHVDGTWRPIDHGGHPDRELFLHRLGGPTNPCLQATMYLGSGRHVIDLAESLLVHGRAAEVRTLLHTHVGAQAALDDLDLPAGGTVSEALAALHENTLQLRMLLAGATRPRDTVSYRTLYRTVHRPTRKGVPARTHR